MDPQGATGIFGGSFNPPHYGHVLACHYALLRWNLAKILVIPSFTHPFAKDLPDFDLRFEMCRLAFRHLGHHIEISDIERQMGGISYTIDTVRELYRRHSGQKFHIIVGGDILAETDQWRDYDQLTKLAPPLVIPRTKNGKVQGCTQTEAALPDIDSTTIRQQLATNTPSATHVPRQVLQFIQEHKLYYNS